MAPKPVYVQDTVLRWLRFNQPIWLTPSILPAAKPKNEPNKKIERPRPSWTWKSPKYYKRALFGFNYESQANEEG